MVSPLTELRADSDFNYSDLPSWISNSLPFSPTISIGSGLIITFSGSPPDFSLFFLAASSSSGGFGSS